MSYTENINIYGRGSLMYVLFLIDVISASVDNILDLVVFSIHFGCPPAYVVC